MSGSCGWRERERERTLWGAQSGTWILRVWPKIWELTFQEILGDCCLPGASCLVAHDRYIIVVASLLRIHDDPRPGNPRTSYWNPVHSNVVTGWPLYFAEVALHHWLCADRFPDDNLDIPAGYVSGDPLLLTCAAQQSGNRLRPVIVFLEPVLHR